MAVYDINRILVPDSPPEYEDHTRDIHFVPAPCQVACPVGTDAPSYIAYIWEKDFEGAFEAITATNPFSSICGRVCDAPCEPACRRTDSDGPVQIPQSQALRDGRARRELPPAGGAGHPAPERRGGRLRSGRPGGGARSVCRRLLGARLRDDGSPRRHDDLGDPRVPPAARHHRRGHRSADATLPRSRGAPRDRARSRREPSGAQAAPRRGAAHHRLVVGQADGDPGRR